MYFILVFIRTREELVKVISQLKNGEDINPLVTNTAEESSSGEAPPPQEAVEEVPLALCYAIMYFY